MSSLKQQIDAELKEAMKTGKTRERDALRLITSAIKQIEVDERIVVDDARLLAILDKMLKQRRESIAQYQSANRQDLVEKEQFEVAVIQKFMPAPLSDAELDVIIAEAIHQSGGPLKQNMGKIMATIKPLIQGRADAARVSAQVKERLN
ncbi:MAG: GatB/YqeY domain-containing protein [Gammaproteobacteria bacterium]|nr:GatB/YqeY domain-containing protein [Gammaproteobacteria bacterium]